MTKPCKAEDLFFALNDGEGYSEGRGEGDQQGKTDPQGQHSLQSSPLPLANVRVLVAEDNMINQLIIEEQLKSQGASYQIVTNGKVCLEILAQDSQFDVILMDIQMPVLDGLATTKQIRALDSDYCEIPIIALTADVYEGAVDNYLAAGMNAYLGKPVKIQQVVECILQQLAVRQ